MSIEKNIAELYVLGINGYPLETGYFGRVVLELMNDDDNYLDEKIGDSPYYDTEKLGYISTDGIFYVFKQNEVLAGYIGSNNIEEINTVGSDSLVHKFNYLTVYREKQYFMIDDEVYGFKHIFPYPGERYLKEYYQKFSSNPSLRNFNFDYHFSVLKNNVAMDSFVGLDVLDVASGNGSFLFRIKNNGANVIGFEPSKTECEEAKKDHDVDLINSTFQPDKLEKGRKFDMVIAGNILEHVREPYDFMEEIKSVMKPEGHLFFQIPNDFNPLQEKYLENTGSNPWFVCPPEHVNYWDVEQSRNFLNKVGFEILHEEAQFPIEMFLLFGMDYRANPELGKKAHEMRCNFEDSFANDMATLSNIYSNFIQAGVGRDYVAVCRLAS